MPVGTRRCIPSAQARGPLRRGTTKRRRAMQIEEKLRVMGLTLPQPMQIPGMKLPFAPVRGRGNRAYISGAGPLAPDGSLAEPRGKVGTELTMEQGYEAARLTGLAILGVLKRELGDLDRVTAWLRVFGMVNVAPGFTQTPNVINGF